MKKKKVEKFVIERDKALETFSVAELEKFMKKWHKEMYAEFKKASPLTKKATLCKMICAVTKFQGTELEKKASDWLKYHKMRKLGAIRRNIDPCRKCPTISTCDPKEPCEEMSPLEERETFFYDK